MRADSIDVNSIGESLDQAAAALRAGNYTNAEALCQGILRRDPSNISGMRILAAVVGQTGAPKRAIELIQKCIALRPERAEAHVQLARLFIMDERCSDAIAALKRALEIEPQNASAQNDLGLTHLTEGNPAEALQCFERAIHIEPDLALGHYNMGLALECQGLFADAIAAFRKATSIKPDFAEAHSELGTLLLYHNCRVEALACFRRAAELKPESVVGLISEAKLRMEQQDTVGAAECARRAVARNFNSSDAHSMLGSILMELGQFANAAAEFEVSIALNRRQIAAYHELARVRRVGERDRPLVTQMEWILKERELPQMQRADLHLALGKAYDDLGQYNLAIAHFDAGNRLKHGTDGSYVATRLATIATRIIDTYSTDFFAETARQGSKSELPLLIVSMPRSGSTLVEQILSSHPDIAAGGELPFWGEQAPTVRLSARGDIDPAWIEATAREYEKSLALISPTARRVTDKWPQNFDLLWLIFSVFPRARVIHCRRHAIDACLSMYFQNFSRRIDFANDRADLLSYYREYNRLMAHWRSVLPPDRFMEVQYEELVANPEAVTRKMIEFCGLEWDDACLHPERNKRAVRTASVWQARQPVYRTSVARWRNYEPWLGPLRELLPDTDRMDTTTT